MRKGSHSENTARMLRAQAELHGLSLTESRSKELAADLERHVAAIATAAAHLDFNDEPARFIALLQPVGARRGKAS